MKLLKKLWAWLKAGKKVEVPVEKPVEVPKQNPPAKADKLLWVPWAIQPKRKMPTSWEYANGYPVGAIIHFTAGRDKTEEDALGSYDWGCDQGYTFFVIGPTGKLYQGFPLNRGGSHAGTSSYPGLGTSVSSKLVGIEVCNVGKLDDNGKSWFGVRYPESEIRTLTDESWDCPAGKYKKCTPEQEASLIKLLKWLKENNPSVFNYDYVLAHSEVAGKKTLGYWRKPDIGGSFSMSIADLRKKLKEKSI